jgi:hypothetical protein
MTKREVAKAQRLNKIKFELGLLIPSFSLMYSQYQSASDKVNVAEHDDLIIANKLIKKIAFAINPYKQLHKESSKVAVEFMKQEDESHTNVFLTGLSLIGFHYELKEKVIKIKVLDELNDLYDLLCADADKKIVDKSNTYTESVLKKLQAYYGV